MLGYIFVSVSAKFKKGGILPESNVGDVGCSAIDKVIFFFF